VLPGAGYPLITGKHKIQRCSANARLHKSCDFDIRPVRTSTTGNPPQLLTSDQVPEEVL
jgi:hypothetical protein